METKSEIIVTEDRLPYPRTPECLKYLKLRAEHEHTQGKRAAWNLLAALGGTSGLNNAADNEEFRKIQYAYHDCQMTAIAFFSAKKASPNRDMVVENENGLIK